MSNSQITIRLKDSGEVVLSGFTDENGVITLVKTEVINAFAKYGATLDDEILIIAQGGEDLNPVGDNSINSKVSRSIGGKITAHTTFNRAQSNYVNGVTSILDKVTQSHITNLDQAVYDNAVNMFLEQAGFKDVNSDGHMNYVDAISYDVINNDSELETRLSGTFYEAIYQNGNLLDVLKTYQQSTNLIHKQINTDEPVHKVLLTNVNPDAFIEYYIVNESEARQEVFSQKASSKTRLFTTENNDYVWIAATRGEAVLLNPGETLGYRENF